jgi:hypothetical protein
MTAGLICLFVIDGLRSIATDIALNVIPNTALAAIYLIGLSQKRSPETLSNRWALNMRQEN